MNYATLSILLVEDNPYDAELTIRALTEKKLTNEIVHVHDGAAALEYIFCTGQYNSRDINDLPGLIMLDLKMPKVNGMEVLKTIKQHPRTKTIPIVVLTSSNEDPDVIRCYELGANSYIVKPVEFDNFTNAITEIGMYWLLLNKAPR